MARSLSNSGVVLVGAQAVGLIQSFGLTINGNQVPANAMGDTVNVNLAGKPEVQATVDVLFDDADAGQALLVQGSSITLELRPDGTGSGLPEFTVTGEVLSESYTWSVDQPQLASFTVTADALPDRTDQV